MITIIHSVSHVMRNDVRISVTTDWKLGFGVQKRGIESSAVTFCARERG
jgi:hypothetical protein